VRFIGDHSGGCLNDFELSGKYVSPFSGGFKLTLINIQILKWLEVLR
jgi:hypothetical protein